MLATQKRRLVRRRWIGLPIGMMMHLVLDGIWARAEVFWWPFFGVDFGDGGLPELGHSFGVTVLFELVGAGLPGVGWQALRLRRPGHPRPVPAHRPPQPAGRAAAELLSPEVAPC